MCIGTPPETVAETFKNELMNMPVEPVDNDDQVADDNNADIIDAGDGQLPAPAPVHEEHIAPTVSEKIQNLKCALESDLMACDAKWTLFVAAAESCYDSQPNPFPPSKLMYLSEREGFNIDALMSTINDTPKLQVFHQRILDENLDLLDIKVVDLLHWVLVELRKPLLKTVDRDEISDALLMQLPQWGRYIKPTLVFEICRISGLESMEPVESDSEESLTAVAVVDSPTALYGDNFDNFFSIIHGGFKQVLNTGQGENGLSLCTDLETVINTRSRFSASWAASACGSIISCVAVCQYINLEGYITPVTESNITHVYVSDHHLVILRYLLFYPIHFPDESLRNTMPRSITSSNDSSNDFSNDSSNDSSTESSTTSSWICRHKYLLVGLAWYAVVITYSGFNETSGGQYLKHLIYKTAPYFFDCRH